MILERRHFKISFSVIINSCGIDRGYLLKYQFDEHLI